MYLQLLLKVKQNTVKRDTSIIRRIELPFYNEIKENLENKYIKNRQILKLKKIRFDEEMRLIFQKMKYNLILNLNYLI